MDDTCDLPPDIGAPGLGGLAARHWKTVILASLGSGFEIYDFIIYGVFAREIAAQFFPSANPVAGLIGTFSVFALGYLVRPFSAAGLGSLGDRIGRRKIFLVSILAMSAATIGIGLLPGYGAIGIAAPLLLVTLRMAQGAFFAGELACSIAYVVEEIPERSGLAAASVVFCLNIGVLAAAFVSFCIHAGLAPPQVQAIGWRIAFLVGGVLGLMSYWFRATLHESTQFARLRAHAEKHPVRELLRHFSGRVVIGTAVSGLVNTANTFLFVLMVPYFISHLHQDPVRVSIGQNIGLVVMAVILLGVGWCTDRIPGRIFQRASAVGILLLSYPYFLLVDQQTIGPILGFILLGLGCGFVNGTYGLLVADLFPTRVRFSGVALSLNLSAMIYTALTPLAVTFLINRVSLPGSPAIVLGVVALVAAVAGLFLRRNSGQIAAG